MRKKRLLATAVLLTMALASTACGKKKAEEPTSTPWDTDFSKYESTKEPDATETVTETEQPDVDSAKAGKDEDGGVEIYYGDSSAEHLTSEIVEEEEVTPELLVKKLVEHQILSDGTKVNSFKETDSQSNGKQLEVDFSMEFQDALFAQGTSGEFLMLGSVVNTFLDAYEADSMLITVEGNTLESGHCIYEKPMRYCEMDEHSSADEMAEKLSEALGAE